MTTYRSALVSLRDQTTKKMAIIPSLAVLMAVVLGVAASGRAQTAPDPKWKPVEDAMGRPGQMQPGDVIRFAMPRKDLHVTLGDVAIKAGLALGSWAAFVHICCGDFFWCSPSPLRGLRARSSGWSLPEA
ncbi:MAG: hypothetical protein QOF56_3448 [Acidobacteriaceae bacterium]|jgi:hypothetical protein|nr:hypothetical protein [Acidobacteriaceae bacterium]